MQIVTQQKYKGKLEHEPWHDTLGEVMNSFKMSPMQILLLKAVLLTSWQATKLLVSTTMQSSVL